MDRNDKHSGAKYIVEARFTVDGVVERHDVMGAIFGQTEGLLPSEFELREARRSGKIRRIDIDIKSGKDETCGKIILPSSLDRAETAIIAASMETVDRVGPCDAQITIDKIADIRSDKRRRIVKRAKELMRKWVVKETQDIDELLEEVSEEGRKIQPVHYGSERLTATPDISKRGELVVVEGRADVINLIKSGIRGVIALGGVKIPDTIKNLVKSKEVTAFLDGDRGGDLILKEMTQVAKPEYIARAPRGKEVEDLTPNEVEDALSQKVPFKEVAVESELSTVAEELQGTLEGVLMTRKGQRKARLPVTELIEKAKESKDVDILVFDGIITTRLIDAAKKAGLHTIVGARIAEGIRIPRDIEVKSFED